MRIFLYRYRMVFAARRLMNADILHVWIEYSENYLSLSVINLSVSVSVLLKANNVRKYDQ